MRRYFIATTLLLLIGTNVALASGPAGNFKGRGEGRLELSVSKSNQVNLTTTIGRVGCMGHFTAKGKMIGERIMQADKEEFGKVCSLTLYFDTHFNNVSTQEDNCTIFHGAACGFSGVLKRIR